MVLSDKAEKVLRIILVVLCVVYIAVGLWMICGPAHWYHNLPSNVSETGPLNIHFVVDIGIVFLFTGAYALWGAFQGSAGNQYIIVCATWHILHAVWHAVEIISGRVGSHRWLADFPGIFFPAFVWVGLIFGLVFKRTAGRPTEVAVEYADLSASNLRRERRIS